MDNLYSLKSIDKNKYSIIFHTILKDIEYTFEKKDNETVRISYTASNWINQEVGIYIHPNKVLVNNKEIHAFKLNDISAGQKVYVYEHINLEGISDWMISSDRIETPTLHFMNIDLVSGDASYRRILRVDIYTGEFSE